MHSTFPKEIISRGSFAGSPARSMKAEGGRGALPDCFFSSFILMRSSFRRHGVCASWMPRAAANDASQRQPRAAERAVPLDGLARVGRAGRVEPALAAKEGGEKQLVSPDEAKQKGLHQESIALRTVAGRGHCGTHNVRPRWSGRCMCKGTGLIFANPIPIRALPGNVFSEPSR